MRKIILFVSIIIALGACSEDTLPASESQNLAGRERGAASDNIKVARQVFSLSVGVCADLFVDCVLEDNFK